MEIADIIAMLSGIEGGDEAATTLADHSRLSEGMTARITELETANAELEAKYLETAARNYELMSAVTAPVDSEAEAEDIEEDTDEDADISDLIKERD